MARWLARIDAEVWFLTETDDRMTPGPVYTAVRTEVVDRPGRGGEGNDDPAEQAGLASIPVRGSIATQRVTEAIIACLDPG